MGHQTPIVMVFKASLLTIVPFMISECMGNYNVFHSLILMRRIVIKPRWNAPANLDYMWLSQYTKLSLYLWYGCAYSVAIIGMKSSNSNWDFCFQFYTNAFGKCRNPFLLSTLTNRTNWDLEEKDHSEFKNSCVWGL